MLLYSPLHWGKPSVCGTGSQSRTAASIVPRLHRRLDVSGSRPERNQRIADARDKDAWPFDGSRFAGRKGRRLPEAQTGKIRPEIGTAIADDDQRFRWVQFAMVTRATRSFPVQVGRPVCSRATVRPTRNVSAGARTDRTGSFIVYRQRRTFGGGQVRPQCVDASHPEWAYSLHSNRVRCDSERPNPGIKRPACRAIRRHLPEKPGLESRACSTITRRTSRSGS